MTKHSQWNGTLSQEGYDILKGEGGCIVCPTKVGYIIMTSDKAGLERKFEAKERNRNFEGRQGYGARTHLCSPAMAAAAAIAGRFVDVRQMPEAQ